MFANQFAENDGKLKVAFLAPPSEHKKSDAFILQYGKEIFTVDGGMDGTHYFNDSLMKMRAELLKDHPELIEDPSCKLKITCIISHYHTDHVCGLLDPVMSNEYVAIDAVYQGAPLNIDPEINKISKSGDEIYRPRLAKLIAEHNPECKIVDIGFGKEHMLKIQTHSGLEHEVELTFLPASADWGVGERYTYMQKYYDIVEKPHRTNVYTMNSASVWLHVKLGKNTFLFTGDTIKRRDDLCDEALDEMTELYVDEYSPVTVLKYVHHGIKRECAVNDMLKFKPSSIVFTSSLSTGEEDIKERAPEEYGSMSYYVSGDLDLFAECSADSDVVFTQDKEA